MAEIPAGLDLKEVFATFRTHRTVVHVFALLAGFVVCSTVAVVVAPFGGSLGTVAAASITTGAYYGILYTRGLGGPVWDVTLPGLVTAVALRIGPARPPGGFTGVGEWMSAITAYGTIAITIWLWHRHLGGNQHAWAATNYPPVFTQFLESDDP